MNRNGPGPQPLRNINNVFQNQPNTNIRQSTLSSSRLQNGKIGGNGPGWGYTGMGAAGAAGPQSGQPRQNAISSFAQTIGGGHNQAQLDLTSDFPSLSGAPQPQQQNTNQAVWGTSNVRGANANAPVQRPLGQSAQNNAQPTGPSPTHQQQGADSENARPSPFAPLSSLDDFRYDDHGGTNRDTRRTAQQGASDDFPPLGGLGRADPRPGVGQTSQLVGLGAGTAYVPGHARNGPFQTDSQADGLAPLSAGGRVMSQLDVPTGASRSPLEAQDDLNGGQRQPPSLNTRMPQGSSQDSIILPQRDGRLGQQSQDAQSRYPSGEQAANNSSSVTPSDNHPADTQQMSELDRYGLTGFLAELRGASADHLTLRLGMDLNTLGLDLNRQGPLHTDWAGPFANDQTRPVVPDFKLPAAYTVQNVPPLDEKLPSFSDETLFTIFYSMARDRAQELAANELYSRDWRWHKRLTQWMMKAKEFGDPQQLPSGKEERGWYYFFDQIKWKRERKEFILNYEHLYHPSERMGIGATL